jgi:tricorn protease
VAALISATKAADPGYFRQPAIHGESIVFVAEGDLWSVPLTGGHASRLSTHPAAEENPAISPNGKFVAFTARLEGPTDVYVMPRAGGNPRRLTFDDAANSYIGWAPYGKVLIGTSAHAGLPNAQLVALDFSSPDGSVMRTRVPLAQAADGNYSADGKTLFFTRLRFQGSHTKRYKGGTAQQIWSYGDGEPEAKPLTADYEGTSKSPMVWGGRIYFASDRDGTTNLWSIKPDGGDPRQPTRHKEFDLKSPSMSNGRVAYHLAADLHVFDIASGSDKAIPITLDSDFDHAREKWIKQPIEFLTDAHPSPDATKVVVTARGRVFVVPRKGGRLVEAGRKTGVRYRNASFMPYGKTLLFLSDESGEVELWTVPADGAGDPMKLTADGVVLRRAAAPSPDGKYVAHTDKNKRLFLLNVATKVNKQIAESMVSEFSDLTWSPDSKWVAYTETGENSFRRIKLQNVVTDTTIPVTTDRYDSLSPVFAADGKWLYLLSNRNLKSLVKSPWGRTGWHRGPAHSSACPARQLPVTGRDREGSVLARLPAR